MQAVSVSNFTVTKPKFAMNTTAWPLFTALQEEEKFPLLNEKLWKKAHKAIFLVQYYAFSIVLQSGKKERQK